MRTMEKCQLSRWHVRKPEGTASQRLHAGSSHRSSEEVATLGVDAEAVNGQVQPTTLLTS